MAVRDRNLFAWQAYVITMAIVSVGLLVCVFLLWSSLSATTQRFEDRETQLSNAQTQFTLESERVERLLSMMGEGNYTADDLTRMQEKFANDEKLAEVETKFQKAMAFLPEDTKEENKNLMKLPETLELAIRVRNRDIVDARKVTQNLQKQLEDTIATETAARKKAVEAQQAAERDLTSARQQHAAAVVRLNSEKESAIKQFNDYRAGVEQAKAELRGKISELTTLTTKQAETIKIQAKRIQETIKPDFAAPQGEIVKVINGGRTVWIDLGSEDGLRAGVPFSVIDESSVNTTEAKTKAQLVVTRIVDVHLCVAELTVPSDYKNPVVTGDKVYSPAWRPGRTVGFALVGLMDFNQDRRDDFDQLESLIQRAGGSVDARMDTNGQTSGKGMSPNTSFLVLGTDMKIPENASQERRAELQAKNKLYANFMAEARQNGIVQISLDKLMGYLKTKGSDRTIPLGASLDGQDFPIEGLQNPPESTGRVSDIFYPRGP